ncbi:hypothetical protein K431DRAFT_301746 [Polychaeton citri CBS 116435]|uniref:Secreted protein n=1 Tax=Polychaeton citri CBS 116435 TaxID=1314669 RepID=A0A9P4USW1_9PEZI|nr:hypothetical protein K431DRAFT_301746 [Polychaeton citri CBS 116435]
MAPLTSLLTPVVAGFSILAAFANAAPQPNFRAEIVPIQARQSNESQPPCTYGNFGLKKPEVGTVITQIDDGNYDGTTFEVLYCSSQYFKTRSISATIGLGWPDSYTSGGQILGTPGLSPTDDAADAGYYGYRVNVTVYPLSGNYLQGEQTLSVFEVASGYYNAYNYDVASVNITFAVQKTDNKV